MDAKMSEVNGLEEVEINVTRWKLPEDESKIPSGSVERIRLPLL